MDCTVHKVGRENHIARFLSAIPGSEVLTLNIKSAELAGRIYADLERTGQPIGRADPIIAAIALENNLALSTGNINHYQRIQSAGYHLILTQLSGLIFLKEVEFNRLN